jgi:hypothetical protein
MKTGVPHNLPLTKIKDVLRKGCWHETGEECTMRSFITYTPYQILLG